jgi:predicted 3-demethylubiquinone-9 3-methyltransferase (glyoxalase superfamily)
MKKFSNCIWLEKGAEETYNYYKKIFKGTKLKKKTVYSEGNKYGNPGSVLTVELSINGQDFIFLNGGSYVKLNSGVSFLVHCKTQKELDYYSDKLGKDGEYQMCGWLTDKFGVTWQIYPDFLLTVLKSKNKRKYDAVMSEVLNMQKYDIAKLKKVYKETK